MSRKWTVADVLEIEDDLRRFQHVVDHLYSLGEAWVQVVPAIGNPRKRARCAGCRDGILKRSDFRSAREDCRRHVLSDHDSHYAPAYRRSLEAAQAHGRHGETTEKRAGWCFVGDSGEFVIVRLGGPAGSQPIVRTAYRVTPTRRGGKETRDFFERAVRKLRDKTSWRGGGT